jgi:hypothetical protein
MALVLGVAVPMPTLFCAIAVAVMMLMMEERKIFFIADFFCAVKMDGIGAAKNCCGFRLGVFKMKCGGIEMKRRET